MSIAIYKKYGEPFIQPDPENDPEKFSYNQTALARMFVEEQRLCYDSDRGKFAQYSPETGLWSHYDDPFIKGWLSEFIRKQAHERKLEIAATKITSGLLSSVTEVVRAVSPVPEIAGDRPHLFPVANGVLDLKGTSAKLLGFADSNKFCNGSPVDFAPKAKCPQFLNELLGAALEEEDISLVQRYFGSVLAGPNLAQRFMVLRGTSGGGKSTLVTVLESVIGQANVATLRTEHLGSRFEAASFLGKRLLTAKDVSGDCLKGSGAKRLKSLVGGDWIDAERKFHNERKEVKGTFHVVIAVNNHLTLALDGDDDAWRRRVLIVEFAKPRTAKPIGDFAGKLVREEGSGILNWLIEGALVHKQEMKKHGDFLLEPEQRQRIDDMIDESQAVKTFVKHRVAFSTGSSTSISDLKNRYFAFCQEKNWAPLTERQFENELPAWMHKIHRVAKRNDIKQKNERGTGYVRGYKDVVLT